MLHSGCSALHALNPLPLKKKKKTKKRKQKTKSEEQNTKEKSISKLGSEKQ